MLSCQHLQECRMSVVDSILSDCSSVLLYLKKAAVHIVGHFESVLLLELIQLSLQYLQHHQLGCCRQLSQAERMKSSVLPWWGQKMMRGMIMAMMMTVYPKQ
jgi:hypothetical protein